MFNLICISVACSHVFSNTTQVFYFVFVKSVVPFRFTSWYYFYAEWDILTCVCVCLCWGGEMNQI